MADTKTDEVLNGTETSQEEKTPDENLPAPLPEDVSSTRHGARVRTMKVNQYDRRCST